MQGTRLVPTELKAKALFEQAASIEFANFHPYARGAYLQAIVQPYALSTSRFVNIANPGVSMLDLPIDQVVLSKALADLSERLDVYEEILGRQRFLAGDVGRDSLYNPSADPPIFRNSLWRICFTWRGEVR